MSSYLGAFQDYYQPAPTPLQFSKPGVTNFNLTSNPMLSKAALDGTNVFGANSKPGAWGDWGSTTPTVPVDTGASFMKSLLGYKDAQGNQFQGWGGLALGAAQGIGNLFMGMQQYNLAKESLANSKAQFEKNYAAQAQTTNTALEDRQRARVASNAGAYESVDSYMSKHKVV